MDVTNATEPMFPEWPECAGRSPDPNWHFGHARGQPAPCQLEAVPSRLWTHLTPRNV